MDNGIIVPVLRKTRFEYSFLAAGTSQSIQIQPALDTGSYYYYQLIVRVHELMFSGSQTIQLVLANTLPSEEDPREFSGGAASSVTITGAASVPGIVSVSGTDPGAFMKLTLIANQPAAPGTLYAELSAVLVLRSA